MLVLFVNIYNEEIDIVFNAVLVKISRYIFVLLRNQ